MKIGIRAFAVVTGVLAFSTAAVAGEVNGSKTNVKKDYSQGASYCKFSGLNDDPTAPIDGPNGPGGRVQNYGHEMRLGFHDPTTGDVPGHGEFSCNPTEAPITPESLGG
jgi:hypothetical protein